MRRLEKKAISEAVSGWLLAIGDWWLAFSDSMSVRSLVSSSSRSSSLVVRALLFLVPRSAMVSVTLVMDLRMRRRRLASSRSWEVRGRFE